MCKKSKTYRVSTDRKLLFYCLCFNEISNFFRVNLMLNVQVNEALAKPQVSPGAIHIQPLSGLSQVSPGVKARGEWGYSFNNINPVGVERE